MATLREQLTGGDAEEFYRDMFVDRGLVREERILADAKKNKKGFNLSRMVDRANSAQVQAPSTTYEQVKEPTDIRGGEYDSPMEHDDFGVVQVTRDPLRGWKQFLQANYGTKNPFLAELALASKVTDPNENPVRKTKSTIETITGGDGTRARNLTPSEKLVRDQVMEKQTGLIDSGVVQASTPILIDPDIFNTVRTAAPILDIVPNVVQAGFTASYNVISARDAVNANSSLGMQAEDDVDDLSGISGQGMTLQNTDKDMKIFVDLANISDFSRRAESSLGFMDLEGTTLNARTQEYATFKAQQFFYGDPDQGASDGSVEDSAAYEGLREFADQTSNTTPKSGVSLSGDKALFKDIKSEIVSLIQNQAVSVQDLHCVCSPQTFDFLENEAQINVRLDAFDGTANFGGMTLSIMNVPITADPNIQNYGGLSGSSNVGDVFIFDERAIQFRALAPYFALPLGRLGLADRTALAEYGTLIDKSFHADSDTSHTRVLQDYQVT